MSAEREREGEEEEVTDRQLADNNNNNNGYMSGRCRISEDEDGDNANGESANSVYRIKYERAARELEFTKRRLQTQHEHDLEQLVGLKKQLEKKVRVPSTPHRLMGTYN